MENNAIQKVLDEHKERISILDRLFEACALDPYSYDKLKEEEQMKARKLLGYEQTT